MVGGNYFFVRLGTSDVRQRIGTPLRKFVHHSVSVCGKSHCDGGGKTKRRCGNASRCETLRVQPQCGALTTWRTDNRSVVSGDAAGQRQTTLAGSYTATGGRHPDTGGGNGQLAAALSAVVVVVVGLAQMTPDGGDIKHQNKYTRQQR